MGDALWKRIDAAMAAVFARDTLLSPSRARPVVGLTTSFATRQPWIDPAELARELGERALVVLLESGEDTWALSAALPPRLDVYGGAVRIWWPGLAPDSDPFDHVLLLIHDEREAARAHERILAAILGKDAGAGQAGRWKGSAPAAAGAPLAEGRADPALQRPARPGTFDPWRRIGEEYRAGDVVPARVFRIDRGYVLAELLPGAGVVVPLREIDWTYVSDPAEVLTVGERVNVELLELDPAAGRGLASIKRALLAQAREGIALRPGDPPYLAAESVAENDAHLRRSLLREREAARKQEEELEAAVTDRQRLAGQCEELKAQLAAARKELQRAEGRISALEQRIAGELDPLASESAFLAAVRVEHARRFDESDGQRYPLARMRVGKGFLDSLRRLEGIDVEKVVEVCAQVASGRAHEIPGRAVHELTEGVAGRAIVRASDGAKAWRCALQVGSPSARRLHWWSIPAKAGTAIEFANVAVHDEYSIPG